MTKSYNLRFLKIFILSAFITTTFAQKTIVSYDTLLQPIFPNQSKPVVIGILAFTSNGVYSNVTERIYNEVLTPAVNKERFNFLPFKTLDDYKDALNVSTLNPDDSTTCKMFFENYEMQYLFYGNVDSASHNIDLKIKNISIGKIVYEKEFINSDSSTAIKDIVKLFSGVEPVYKTIGPGIAKSDLTLIGEIKFVIESDIINNVSSKLKDQKLQITYDLNGEPDAEYEVNIFLENKMTKVRTELKQISGEIGNGIKPNINKNITWNFRNELEGKINFKDYELKLTADKQGGISWLVYAIGGTAVAGGIIYEIFKPKEKPPIETPNTAIGPPPSRP